MSLTLKDIEYGNAFCGGTRQWWVDTLCCRHREVCRQTVFKLCETSCAAKKLAPSRRYF